MAVSHVDIQPVKHWKNLKEKSISGFNPLEHLGSFEIQKRIQLKYHWWLLVGVVQPGVKQHGILAFLDQKLSYHLWNSQNKETVTINPDPMFTEAYVKE